MTPLPKKDGTYRHQRLLLRNNVQREDWRRQMKEQARAKARQLAQEFVQRGDATGWFEKLYTQAQGNE